LDLGFFLTPLLAGLAVTFILLTVYRVRITSLIREYKDSKGLVEALSASIHRKLFEQSKHIEYIRGLVDRGRSEVEQIKVMISERDERLETLTESLKSLMKADTMLAKKVENVVAKLSRIDAREAEMEEQIKALDQRYLGLLPETETASTLPVHGENALSKLTSTEIQILLMLFKRGPLAVADIKGEIGKTREHTARLMKKLHENGYVERETSTIPYTYKVAERYRTSLERLEQRGTNTVSSGKGGVENSPS